MRGGFALGLLLLAACMPTTPKLQLPQDCRAEFSAAQLANGNWLNRPGVWRLRQVALLEIGRHKVPLEGFLRLDPARHQARLLALNEMGVVLFDLRVDAHGEQLQRAIPQLQRVKGLARGVAQSLRRIFLQPRPQADDRLAQSGSSERLQRSLLQGEVDFLFDCRGDLRETRRRGADSDWRVAYFDYRKFGDERLPGQLVLNDYRNRVKLSLWLKEVKREP